MKGRRAIAGHVGGGRFLTKQQNARGRHAKFWHAGRGEATIWTPAKPAPRLLTSGNHGAPFVSIRNVPLFATGMSGEEQFPATVRLRALHPG